MNSTIWRSDATSEPEGSAVGAALKENPSAPPKRDEVSPSSTDRPKLILKEADAGQTSGRGASPAGVKHPASVVLEETPADKRAKTASNSKYSHKCGET